MEPKYEKSGGGEAGESNKRKQHAGRAEGVHWGRRQKGETADTQEMISPSSRPQVSLNNEQVRSLIQGTHATEVLAGYVTEYVLVNGELVTREIGPVAVVVKGDTKDVEKGSVKKYKKTAAEKAIRKRVKLEQRNVD